MNTQRCKQTIRIVSLMVLLGAAIGVLANSVVSPSKRVSSFGFSKTAILDQTLVSSVRSASEQSAAVSLPPAHTPTLEVVVFLSGQCDECQFVRQRALPELRRAFSDRIDLQVYDTDSLENYKKLVEYEQQYGSKEDVTSKMFMRGRYFAGAEEIAKHAVQAIRQSLAQDDSANG